MESFDVGGKKIWIRFSRSFTAKLIQADDTLKARYSELKNELIAYGAKDRMSWSNESFRKGRKTIAKFAIRGKTLSLYLALEPAAYKDTKYFYEDSSGVAKYAGVPMRLRLRSDRSVRWAKELIADLLASYGLQKQEIAAVDYAAWSPYESTDDLIARGLIRVFEQNFEPNFEQGGAQKPKEVEVSADEFMELRREKLREVAGKEVQERTTVAEADASITDEAANALIEREIVRVREDKRKKKKRGIVNLDTISKYFNAGETVTFEKLNEARLVPKGVNYIKVLARGELDKPLRIIADEFSLPAVKMIVLTSGSAAVRTEVVELH
jgi:ribosomal protein L15